MDTMLCNVCYRPGPDRICSQRCHGLLKLKNSLDLVEAQRRLLEEVRKLKKDTSICPGKLAWSVLASMGIALREERDALSILRQSLFDLRAQGQLRFFQKKVLVPKAKGPWELRGPFRVST